MFYPLAFEIENPHLFLGFWIRMMIALVFKRIDYFGSEFNLNCHS